MTPLYTPLGEPQPEEHRPWFSGLRAIGSVVLGSWIVIALVLYLVL